MGFSFRFSKKTCFVFRALVRLSDTCVTLENFHCLSKRTKSFHEKKYRCDNKTRWLYNGVITPVENGRRSLTTLVWAGCLLKGWKAAFAQAERCRIHPGLPEHAAFHPASGQPAQTSGVRKRLPFSLCNAWSDSTVIESHCQGESVKRTPNKRVNKSHSVSSFVIYFRGSSSSPWSTITLCCATKFGSCLVLGVLTVGLYSLVIKTTETAFFFPLWKFVWGRENFFSEKWAFSMRKGTKRFNSTGTPPTQRFWFATFFEL